MDDQQFRQLLNRFGLSWKGYRRVRKGIKKRIRRHMQQLGCRDLETYLRSLGHNQELRQQCERLMTVSISRFLRDRQLWHNLERQILPHIIEKNKERVIVWFAGCACGEEVYSFKIAWQSALTHSKCHPNLEILASDMNSDYLEKAETGIYSRSSLKEVPDKVRAAHFEQQNGERYFVLSPSMKNGILWRIYNLLDDPPEKDFNLIFLRNNLLTYYGHELKKPAFRRIIQRLLPGGFLIIGAREKIPVKISHLIPFKGLPYIFNFQGPNER